MSFGFLIPSGYSNKDKWNNGSMDQRFNSNIKSIPSVQINTSTIPTSYGASFYDHWMPSYYPVEFWQATLVTSGNKSSARTSPVKSFMVETFENIDIDDSKINKAFDIQISKLSLEAILIGSSEVMVQNIVDLFRVAIKLRRKEILCWYCYYKAYVGNVKSKNGIDDKSARTLIEFHIEVEFYLRKNGVITSKTNNRIEVQTNPLEEFSIENFNYYGITDEKSCSLCSLDYNDKKSIEEVFVNEFYNIIWQLRCKAVVEWKQTNKLKTEEGIFDLKKRKILKYNEQWLIALGKTK
ncbi:hypothetical protein GLOIN_2v1869616 [Rhizophagus irregularis DAOM 181602=DAOM 197198]|nr:hypothetical protein GLOIN_2v1869616 [Rhizophagus irregularis DAOM 181602=DAOM 197198]